MFGTKKEKIEEGKTK